MTMSQSRSYDGNFFSSQSQTSSFSAPSVSESIASVSSMSVSHKQPNMHVDISGPEGTVIIKCASKFNIHNLGAPGGFNATIRVSKEMLSQASAILKRMLSEGKWAEGSNRGRMHYIKSPFTFGALVPFMCKIHYNNTVYMVARRQYGLEMSIEVLEEIFIASDYYDIDAKALRIDDRLRTLSEEQIRAFVAETGLDKVEFLKDKIEICNNKAYVKSALQVCTIASFMNRDDLINEVTIILILGTDGFNSHGHIGIAGERYLSEHVPMPICKQLAEIRKTLISTMYQAFQKEYDRIYKDSAAGKCSCAQHSKGHNGHGLIAPGDHCSTPCHLTCVKENKARISSIKGHGGFNTLMEALKSVNASTLYKTLKDIQENDESTGTRSPHARWAEICDALGNALEKMKGILEGFINDEEGREVRYFSLIKSMEDDDDFSLL